MLGAQTSKTSLTTIKGKEAGTSMCRGRSDAWRQQAKPIPQCAMWGMSRTQVLEDTAPRSPNTPCAGRRHLRCRKPLCRELNGCGLQQQQGSSDGPNTTA